MKKIFSKTLVTLLLSASFFCCFTSATLAETADEAGAIEGPSAALDLALFNQYVWRGLALSSSSLVIQPAVTLSYQGAGINLWGNIDTDQQSTTDTTINNWTETDLTLSYDWSVSGIDLGLGYIYYALEGDDTQEFYASIAYDLGFFAPSFTVYRDTDRYSGWYMNMGLSSSIPITDMVTIDVAFTAGYVVTDDPDTYSDPSDTSQGFSDFFDASLTASSTIALSQYWSITPVLSYSFPLSSDARTLILSNNETYGSGAELVYGGISASFSF